jgi:hypothetical protein
MWLASNEPPESCFPGKQNFLKVGQRRRVIAMTRENRFDRIIHDPEVLGGRATLHGLRISVAHVVNLIANGMTPSEIAQDFRT